jgi:hypothetical protein
MVVDYIGDYKKINTKNFGIGLCEWRSLLEWIGCIPIKGYTYDKLNDKLVEVLVNVSHKFSLVHATFAARSFRN